VHVVVKSTYYGTTTTSTVKNGMQNDKGIWVTFLAVQVVLSMPLIICSEDVITSSCQN